MCSFKRTYLRYFRAAVIISLQPKGKYRKIALVRLVGMMLIIFVKEQHVAYVRGVAVDTVGTGIMGKLVGPFALNAGFGWSLNDGFSLFRQRAEIESRNTKYCLMLPFFTLHHIFRVTKVEWPFDSIFIARQSVL